MCDSAQSYQSPFYISPKFWGHPCHGVGELATIATATNDTMHPSPRASVVVMAHPIGTDAAESGKLGPVLVAPWGNLDGTPLEKHWNTEINITASD